MLPRRLRLSRAAFTHTGAEKKLVSQHFSVSLRIGRTGCGVVISKKTEKTAVGRNRLKRRISAVIAPLCGPDHSIVVYARAGSPALSFPALNTELSGLLLKLLGTSRVR